MLSTGLSRQHKPSKPLHYTGLQLMNKMLSQIVLVQVHSRNFQFQTDLVHYHLNSQHHNWVCRDWIHSSSLILCCQISATLWHAFNSQLLGSFAQPPVLRLPAAPGQWLCRSRASDCGFYCLCPGQLTTSSHGERGFTAWPQGPLPKQQERFPVKWAHCLWWCSCSFLWPGGAERLKMVNFNLVSLYLKVQLATINVRLKYRVIWLVSRNKQAATTAAASDLKSCAIMLLLKDFSF